MKIAYISQFAPDDRRASSGTNYKVVEQLGKMGDITWFPIRTPKIYRVFELASKALAKICGRKIYFLYTKLGCNLFARNQKISIDELNKCDVIFAFFNATPFWTITTSKPIVYLTDATYPAMIDYYPPFCNLFNFNKNGGGYYIEECLFDKFTSILCASDWARVSAIEDLHQSSDKVRCIEFGANIDNQDVVEHTFNYTDHLHVLFLGVDWVRKGGEIAVKTCRLLNGNGIKTTLHVVGIKNLDNKICNLPFVDNVGFLDKNIQQEYRLLLKIISRCHLLLLPTNAECAGIAFGEASAFGLPVFTYKTGGVANYVIDGENGYALSITSTEKEFYEKIKACIETKTLEKLSYKSALLYKNKLNWNRWGNEVRSLFNSILNKS